VNVAYDDTHVGEDAEVILFSPQDEHSEVMDQMLNKMGA
jgi:hypothetical protein